MQTSTKKVDKPSAAVKTACNKLDQVPHSMMLRAIWRVARATISGILYHNFNMQGSKNPEGFTYQIRLNEATDWRQVVVLHSPLDKDHKNKAEEWLPKLAEQTKISIRKLATLLLMEAENLDSRDWLEFEGLPDVDSE